MVYGVEKFEDQVNYYDMNLFEDQVNPKSLSHLVLSLVPWPKLPRRIRQLSCFSTYFVVEIKAILWRRRLISAIPDD